MRCACPLLTASFDLVTSAFGFRNLANYEDGLKEIFRVLKPGATLGILEFAEPAPGLLGDAYRFYTRTVLPKIGGWISGDADAYAYLPKSVARFFRPEEFASLLRASWLCPGALSPDDAWLRRTASRRPPVNAGTAVSFRPNGRRSRFLREESTRLESSGLWMCRRTCPEPSATHAACRRQRRSRRPPIASTLVSRGKGCYRLAIHGDIRKKLRVDAGAVVEIAIERDEESREPVLPPALVLALRNSPKRKPFSAT